MSNRIVFPWGVYLGDFLNAQETRIPVCLDSQRGGFCVRFDEDSQEIAYRLVENAMLEEFQDSANDLIQHVELEHLAYIEVQSPALQNALSSQ